MSAPFGVDPFDAIWESPDTGRTASKASDDWCDECDAEIDFSIGGPDGVCGCTTGRDFVGVDCTLDGKDAQIVGRKCDFAIVAQWPEGLRIEYAWTTVLRVMSTNDGRFKS